MLFDCRRYRLMYLHKSAIWSQPFVRSLPRRGGTGTMKLPQADAVPPSEHIALTICWAKNGERARSPSSFHATSKSRIHNLYGKIGNTLAVLRNTRVPSSRQRIQMPLSLTRILPHTEQRRGACSALGNDAEVSLSICRRHCGQSCTEPHGAPHTAHSLPPATKASASRTDDIDTSFLHIAMHFLMNSDLRFILSASYHAPRV